MQIIICDMIWPFFLCFCVTPSPDKAEFMCIVPIPGSVHWHTQYKMIPNITVHYKYNEYDPEFTLFIQVHSGKRIQGRSPSFKCATGEQLLSGVSRPMNDHSDTI